MNYRRVVKPLTLGIWVWGLALGAVAQTNSANVPLTSPAPVAIGAAPAAPRPEPLSTTHADNTRYLNNPEDLAGCQAQLDAIGGKPCDVIFIGDSITAFWLTAGKPIWDARYAPLHALDFGVSGDKTQNVLWRLNNMSLQDLKPKVAVVMIGTNNLDNSPHEIADGVKAVLATTQLTFPGVKIILTSIMPNRRAQDKMMDTDTLLRGLADGTSVYYLDLVPLMPAVTTTAANGQITTNYKGLSPDGLHPDLSGYEIWGDALDPLLKKLLAGG